MVRVIHLKSSKNQTISQMENTFHPMQNTTVNSHISPRVYLRLIGL